MNKIENQKCGRRSRGLHLVYIFVYTVVGLSVGLTIVLLGSKLGDWLDVSESPRPADFAFVVPGEENSRPFVAALLYRYGVVKQVIAPAVKADGLAKLNGGFNHGKIICEVLRRRGVAENDIVTLEGGGTSSWDDIGQLANFLKSHPQATVAVVTNSFHTRRCMWVLKRQFHGDLSRVHFVAAPLEWYDGVPWWNRREVATTVLGEYLKLGYYWVRYSPGEVLIPVFVAAVIASCWFVFVRTRGHAVRKVDSSLAA